MVGYICTCIVLFILISWIWPDTRKKQAESDRKHKELVTAVSRFERQNAVSAPHHCQRIIALNARGSSRWGAFVTVASAILFWTRLM